MASSKKDYPIRITRLHRVRRRLTDGTSKIHFYHRPTKTKLPAPNDPAFEAAYQAAEQLLTMPNKTSIIPEPNAPPPERRIQLTAVASGGASAGTTTTDLIYFTPDEVCRRWRDQLTPETLANWRSLQIGPPYSKFGKTVLYRADLLEQWERKYLFVCDPVRIGAGNERDKES